jgi:hypothetical protein
MYTRERHGRGCRRVIAGWHQQDSASVQTVILLISATSRERVAKVGNWGRLAVEIFSGSVCHGQWRSP